MVRDAAHGGSSALCQRDAEERGSGTGVLKKHLIKVAEAEQQNYALR
jgi:hypothetical protein